MNPIVWWSTLVLVTTAAIIDMRTRKIPNWLVIPFLIAGVAFGAWRNGLAGIEKSGGGIAMAVGLLALPCVLRGIGMGDLKLCAAVGAWIGCSQLTVALVVTAIAGGLMGIAFAALSGAIKKSFDGAAEVVFGFPTRGLRAHATLRLDHSRGLKLPYAPAILIGTLFSFISS